MDHPNGHPENPGPAHHIRHIPPQPSAEHPEWYTREALHYTAVPAEEISICVAPIEVHDAEHDVILETWRIGLVTAIDPDNLDEQTRGELDDGDLDDDGLFRSMVSLDRNLTAELAAGLLNALPWELVGHVFMRVAVVHNARIEAAKQMVVESVRQAAEAGGHGDAVKIPPSPEGLKFIAERNAQGQS